MRRAREALERQVRETPLPPEDADVLLRLYGRLVFQRRAPATVCLEVLKVFRARFVFEVFWSPVVENCRSLRKAYAIIGALMKEWVEFGWKKIRAWKKLMELFKKMGVRLPYKRWRGNIATWLEEQRRGVPYDEDDWLTKRAREKLSREEYRVFDAARDFLVNRKLAVLYRY